MRRALNSNYQPQIIALAIVTVVAFVVILLHVMAQIHYGCSPGPKPAAWTHAQYVKYAATACH